MEIISEFLRNGGLLPKVVLIGAVAIALVALLRWVAPGAAFAGQVMTASEAHEKASRGEITLVDVRTPDEWKQTGVPASGFAITMHQQGQAFLQQLDAALGGDRKKPLAVICRTGNRTGSIVGPLEQAGYSNIINVAEGMAGGRNGRGWLRSGLPVRPWAPGKTAPTSVAAQ